VMSIEAVGDRVPRRPASRQTSSHKKTFTSKGRCRPCCSVEPVGSRTTFCKPMASSSSAHASRL
jgi:hypothetical protein